MRALLLSFSLVGLIIVVAIVAVLATNNFQSLGFGGSGKSSTNPIDSANAVKNKADLKALSVQLNLYFSQNDSYPSTLDQVDLSTLSNANFSYTQCSQIKAYASEGGQFLVVEEGKETFTTEAAC